MNQLRDLIKDNLTESELSELINILQLEGEICYINLRKFFHKEEIFQKINRIYDPTRISFEIFINKNRYEF